MPLLRNIRRCSQDLALLSGLGTVTGLMICPLSAGRLTQKVRMRGYVLEQHAEGDESGAPLLAFSGIGWHDYWQRAWRDDELKFERFRLLRYPARGLIVIV